MRMKCRSRRECVGNAGTVEEDKQNKKNKTSGWFMRVFYINDLPALHIDWEVLKGKCDVREDFDGASIAMFLLCGGNGADLRRENRIALGVTVADNGHLTADIPMSALNVQVYGLRLMWTKDGEIPTALDDMNTESQCGRCRVSISEKFDIFAVTDYESEADADGYGDVTINVQSHSAVYGKDGLDAYELAVLRGYTMLSEAEWLQSRMGVSITDAEGSETDRVPTQRVMTAGLNELREGKVDKVTGKVLSSNDYTDEEKAKLGALPTRSQLDGASGKVDKVGGKGLSENDYTDEDKSKLDSLPTRSELDGSNGKVDKVSGKDLSTNDYTDEDKGKLGDLPTNEELGELLDAKIEGVNMGSSSLPVSGKSVTVPYASPSSDGVMTSQMYQSVTSAIQGVTALGQQMTAVNNNISGHAGRISELEDDAVVGATIDDTELDVVNHKIDIPLVSEHNAGVLSAEDYYNFAGYEDAIEVVSTSVSTLSNTVTQHGTAINNLGSSKVEGAKIAGSSLAVDSNRMIEIPVATTSFPGVVKVDGSSITISNGVITAHTSGGGGVTVVNSLESTSTTDALSANMGHELKGITDGLADDLDAMQTSLDAVGETALDAYNNGIWTASVGSQSISKSNNNLNLPLATASQFGMVKVGSGLSVSNGVISTSGGSGISTIVVNGSSILDEGDTLGADAQGRTVLPLASNSGYGLVKVDNTTVGITNGKLGVLNPESFKWIVGNTGGAYPAEDGDVLNILGYDPTSQDPEDSPIATKVDYTDDYRGFVAIKLNVGSGLTVENGVLKATGGGGGGSVNVINDLNSTSTTDALSANMGRELNVTKKGRMQEGTPGGTTTAPVLYLGASYGADTYFDLTPNGEIDSMMIRSTPSEGEAVIKFKPALDFDISTYQPDMLKFVGYPDAWEEGHTYVLVVSYGIGVIADLGYDGGTPTPPIRD